MLQWQHWNPCRHALVEAMGARLLGQFDANFWLLNFPDGAMGRGTRRQQVGGTCIWVVGRGSLLAPCPCLYRIFPHPAWIELASSSEMKL